MSHSLPPQGKSMKNQLKYDEKVLSKSCECECPFLLLCRLGRGGLACQHACFLHTPLSRRLLDSLWCWLWKIHSWCVDFFLLVKDLKVWRTDPGSIFDIDPLEDNIQSRSLRMLSEKASHYWRQRSRSHSGSTFGTGLGDDKSEISETYPSFSCCSEGTRPSDEGGTRC